MNQVMNRKIIPYYAFLLESCSSNKDLCTLRKLHAQILTIGIAYHDFIRTKLLSSYASSSQLPEALHFFNCVHRRPTFLFNSLIKAYSSLQLHSQSLQFYLYMRHARKLPDCHTFPSVLKSVAALSALHVGRQVHAAVIVSGFSPVVANSNSLISMYAKCGELGYARQLFDNMPEKNVVSWSALIGGYGAHGRCDGAVRLFEGMVGSGVLPDSVTFTAVLAACSHGGLVQKGRRFFDMMERYSVRPRLEHYTCMVDILGRAGHVEEAEVLIGGMDLEPDDALWGALLGACQIHGKVEIAERVAERLCGRAGTEEKETTTSTRANMHTRER